MNQILINTTLTPERLMSVRRRAVKERVERNREKNERIAEYLESKRTGILAAARNYRTKCPEHEIDKIESIIADLESSAPDPT